MTYSIVARDHQTGAVGVIVASRFFAAGAMVPYVGPDFAIASQAFVNPIWGTKGRECWPLAKTRKQFWTIWPIRMKAVLFDKPI